MTVDDRCLPSLAGLSNELSELYNFRQCGNLANYT